MKRINKFCAFILIFFFINDANAQLNKIKVSKTTLNRLYGYLDQSFFSVERNNDISNITSLYFFISKDGNFSVISYCADFYENACDISHQKFKANKRCERISKQDCFLAMDRKNLLINEKIYKNVTHENIKEMFATIPSLLKSNKEDEKNYYSDMSAILLRDFNHGYDN